VFWHHLLTRAQAGFPRTWRVFGFVRFSIVKRWSAAAALAIVGTIGGYVLAEWNFARSCTDVVNVGAQFEENMRPFRDHPDDSNISSRLDELHHDYDRAVTRCRGAFLIRFDGDPETSAGPGSQGPRHR